MSLEILVSAFQSAQVEETAIQAVDGGNTSICRKTIAAGQCNSNEEEVENDRSQDASLLDTYQHVKRIRFPTSNDHFCLLTYVINHSLIGMSGTSAFSCQQRQ